MEGGEKTIRPSEGEEEKSEFREEKDEFSNKELFEQEGTKTPSIFLTKEQSNDKEVQEVLFTQAFNKQKMNIDDSESSEEPLNDTQVSTLKAFEQLRLSVISKINQRIVFSKTLDHNKQMRSITWYHKFFFMLGCLRYNPDVDPDKDLNDVLSDLRGESKKYDKQKALKKLHRNKKLVKKG